jgi:uncharacterized membrane protein
MATPPKVLVAGESWTTHSIHQKGFDSFTTTEYAEGVGWLRAALESGGWSVDYQPSHIAARDFPATAKALAVYDCVILSDIGANTLLIHPETFTRFKTLPNRLLALREYVNNGGGLMMVGGYMTFQGIDGKARYHGTPVEEALPVTIFSSDDRQETPEGATPVVSAADHPISAGLAREWPNLLGYNRLTAKLEATIVAAIGTDPLIVAGAYGKGRGVAFASDCGPHWAPPTFVEWDGYPRLWLQMAAWAAGRT